MAKTWAALAPEATVQVVRTVEEAVNVVRDISRGLKSGLGEATPDAEQGDGEEVVALVTGSLHLVGGLLEVLETEREREMEKERRRTVDRTG